MFTQAELQKTLHENGLTVRAMCDGIENLTGAPFPEHGIHNQFQQSATLSPRQYQIVKLYLKTLEQKRFLQERKGLFKTLFELAGKEVMEIGKII